jgi:hypothetical protein
VSTPICDFCSEPNVVWRYPAQNFIAYATPGIVGQSIGDWAACVVCHEFIDRGDHDALLERSVRRLLEKNPDMRTEEAEVREDLRLIHRMFFEHQAGAPLPVA